MSKYCNIHGFSNCMTCSEKKAREKFEKLQVKSLSLTKKRKDSKPSKGEQSIIDYLNSKNIIFDREKIFSGLYNHRKTSLLYYDFFLHRYNLCIEFDGSQHYSSEKTNSEQANDFIKSAYCKKNEINFLRIKYTDIDNIPTIIKNKIDKLSDDLWDLPSTSWFDKFIL